MREYISIYYGTVFQWQYLSTDNVCIQEFKSVTGPDNYVIAYTKSTKTPKNATQKSQIVFFEISRNCTIQLAYESHI